MSRLPFPHRWMVLLLAACDGQRPVEVATALARPPPAFRASCTTAALGVCTEYTDDAFGLGESLLKTGCLETRGTWSPARCPAERRLGTCVLRGASRVYYPGGDLDFSSVTAARDCVELYQGVFSARAAR